MRGWMPCIVFACLTGCTSSPYGNFAEHSTPAINQRLANDSVRQLAEIRPPASTSLQIGQEITDGYGLALIRRLRAAGYAVHDFSTRANTADKPTTSVNAPLLVNYIVDAPRESGLYRVTLRYGRESISRAYAMQKGGLQPAGAWTRRE